MLPCRCSPIGRGCSPAHRIRVPSSKRCGVRNFEAKAEIRAVLLRLAGEFDISGHEVDEAMAQVGETLSELTGEIESDLAYDIEHADQY